MVFYKIPSTSYKQPSHDLGIFAPQFPMVNVPLFSREVHSPNMLLSAQGF